MAFLASVLSALLASTKDVLSKQLSFRIDGMTSTFASFSYALPFYVVVLAVLYPLGAEGFALTQSFLLLILLRSVTDTFAEALKMHALAHGDLSVVATFFSISPLFLLIASPLLTGDPLSAPDIVAVLLVVGGSLALVYRPSAAHWAGQGRGILLAVGASLFFSLNSCFDRLAVKEEVPAAASWSKDLLTATLAGFGMTLLSALFLLPLVLFRGDRREALRRNRGGLWLRGLLEVAFMVCKLYALRYLSATDVVGIQRLSLVISILGGRFVFREPDFGRRLAAAVLILAGAALIGWMHLDSGALVSGGIGFTEPE